MHVPSIYRYLYMYVCHLYSASAFHLIVRLTIHLSLGLSLRYWLGLLTHTTPNAPPAGAAGTAGAAVAAAAAAAAVVELFPYGLSGRDWYEQIAATSGPPHTLSPHTLSPRRCLYFSWANRDRDRAVFHTKVVEEAAQRMRALGASKDADTLPDVLGSDEMDPANELSQLYFKNQDTVVDISAVAALVREAVLGTVAAPAEASGV
jgi:hypothetical protein